LKQEGGRRITDLGELVIAIPHISSSSASFLRQPVRACFPLFAKGCQPIAPEPISVSNCRVKIMEEYGNLSLVARPNVRIVKKGGNTE